MKDQYVTKRVAVRAIQYAPNMPELPEHVFEEFTGPDRTGHCTAYAVRNEPGYWLVWATNATDPVVMTDREFKDQYQYQYAPVKPKCCLPGCGCDAEFEITDSNDPDPHCNNTHACARHIGDLLGSRVGVEPTGPWHVHLMG